MTDTASNAAQREFWDATAPRWVEWQADFDTAFDTLTERLIAHAALVPGEQAIDIGCGTGATLLRLADAVEADGRVHGVDIAEAMVVRAQERLAGIETVTVAVADAATTEFPFAADLVLSRFGLMFFDAPGEAFRHILTAIRPGGRIAFVAWAAITDNPFFAVPRAAAVARLGPVEPAPADAPGPFAFADAGRVRSILDFAGFADVAIATEPVELRHPAFERLVDLATRSGPAARILAERNGTAADAAAITDAVATGFAPFAEADGISVPASVHLVTARRPA